jgi:hypothetical protein
MSVQVASAIAQVTSNLLLTDRVGNRQIQNTSTDSPQLQPESELDQQQQSKEVPTVWDNVQSILAGVAQAVAANMAPNQLPVTIETEMFSMEIMRLNTQSKTAVNLPSEIIVQLPLAELPPNFQLQVIKWTENRFGPLTLHPSMVVSSHVTTVNIYTEGEVQDVQGLNATIQVALSTVGIANSITNQETAYEQCTRMECLNRYDVAQLSVSACTDLIESGYTCDKHFCKE